MTDQATEPEAVEPDIPGKPTSASRTTLSHIMTHNDTNLLGTVHGGVIMKLVDDAAGAVAGPPARGPAVTAAMDEMAVLEPGRGGGRVQVANGTGTTGLAKRIDTELAATGFATTHEPVTAPAQLPATVITYDPRWDRSAHTLAAALPGSELRAAPGQGPVLKVTAGAGFKGVRAVRFEDPGHQDQGTASVVRGNEVVCSGDA